MLTVTVPPELAGPLAEMARRLGTTPELMVLEAVRSILPPPPPPEGPGTLRDFLAGYVGVVEGTGEPFSQDCGRKFADDLVAGRRARP